MALVVRSNLVNIKTEQIKKAFLALGTSKDGHKALSQIGLAGISFPGKALNQKRLAPEPPPAQIVEKQQKPSKEKAKIEEPAAKPATNKRMTLFIALVIFAAIIFKTVLFVLRWKKRKESSFRPKETPTMGTNFDVKSLRFNSQFLRSHWNKNKMSLSKKADWDLARHLSSSSAAQTCRDQFFAHYQGSCEKLVYFAVGQVSGALTQHSTIYESGVRWNKFGNLLV